MKQIFLLPTVVSVKFIMDQWQREVFYVNSEILLQLVQMQPTL
jgi:hypothetical protein